MCVWCVCEGEWAGIRVFIFVCANVFLYVYLWVFVRVDVGMRVSPFACACESLRLACVHIAPDTLPSKT